MYEKFDVRVSWCSYICDVNLSISENNIKLPCIWTVFHFGSINSNIFVMILMLFFHQAFER